MGDRKDKNTLRIGNSTTEVQKLKATVHLWVLGSQRVTGGMANGAEARWDRLTKGQGEEPTPFNQAHHIIRSVVLSKDNSN